MTVLRAYSPDLYIYEKSYIFFCVFYIFKIFSLSESSPSPLILSVQPVQKWELMLLLLYPTHLPIIPWKEEIFKETGSHGAWYVPKRKKNKKASHVNKILNHLELKHCFYFCYFSVSFLPIPEIMLTFK